MDQKPSTVKHEKRSPKSTKKKPVKVVYISNPMKINATPSEFRAVVQQLTGKYATSPPPETPATVVNKDDDGEVGGGGGFVHHQLSTSAGSDLYDESICGEDRVMDNIIMPQTVSSFASLLPSEYGS